MEDKRNKCISCAYLCNTGSGYIGIARRRDTLQQNPDATLRCDDNNLVCYKGILPSFYITGISKEERCKLITEQECPKKKWKLFANGQTPEQAELQETSAQSIHWSKLAFVAIIVSSIVAIAVSIISSILSRK